MKETRALMVLAVVAGAFAGGAVVQWAMTGCATVRAAQPAVAQTVRARSISIVDDTGRERIFLGMDGDRVGMLMRDAEKRERVALGYTGAEYDYWVLGFMDAEGQPRFGCGVRDDGTESGGHVSDGSGAMRISFGEGSSGVGIALRNSAGQERLGIGIGPGAGGGDFVMKDAEGNAIWRASQHVQDQ